MNRPIAIIGPTGTGKSALALRVAERVGGEIVNADAMQLYRGMDIGTAKLTRGPTAWRRPPPTRRAGGHRDRHRRALPARRRGATWKRSRRAAPCPSSSAGRCSTSSPAGRLVVPGHRFRGPGAVGAPARRGRRRPAAPRAGRCRRRRGGVDPAHRRPPHRAGPGGGGADRRAVRGVRPRPSAHRAGTPAIIGLDWPTSQLDQRLGQRTDKMFADGLVGEVRRLLDSGLRDGVHGVTRAGLRAGDRRARPGGGDGAARPRADVHRAPAATCAGSGRGSGATTASAGSREASNGVDDVLAGGATYPEQVIFAKGHGTQNDFVLLWTSRRS